MTPLPASVQRYLQTRAAQGPWMLAGDSAAGMRGAIVIPSLAEGDSLLATLHSLAANPAALLKHFLIIVVVNHRENSAGTLRAANSRDLQSLARLGSASDLTLAWVDAATPGNELPQRGGSVGMARKIGLDLALFRLDWGDDPLLVMLDADTLVEPNYLAAIEDHFETATAGAAALAFRHQPVPDPAHQAAIDRYQLFMYSYALGLARAGSPYGFTAVGSAIACRAATYVRCGGMNRRSAGEDFYFLQQAAKTDGVAPLHATRVHPSARRSDRTPFGTGMNVTQQLDGTTPPLLFYPVAAYRVLAAWLAVAANARGTGSAALWEGAAGISPVLVDFLEECGLEKAWSGIARNFASHPERLRAFHGWFDGLKSLRLIHTLCDRVWPRQEPEEAVPELLAWCGQQTAPHPGGLLERVRSLQEQSTAP